MAIGKEIEAFKVMESEQELWTIDQVINDRGVHIDKALMLGAYELDKISKSSLNEQAKN